MRLAESSAMCSELLRSQVQLVNMVSQRFSDSHYGMPAPSWPYTPYYTPYGMHPPPGSDPQSLQPGVSDYMQKLQQYHAALQEAHYRLMSQQSGPPSSVEEREQGVGAVPPFSSGSVNLPPPPPPPAGLFGASPQTFNFAPRGFPFQPSLGNTSHSNNIGLMQEKPSPLGRSHLAGPVEQVHHQHPRSPSGVTADSMQVVAPSSPQSAYSSVRPMQEGEQEPSLPQAGESSSAGRTVHVSSVPT